VRPYLKNNSSKKDWEGVIQVAEHLPGKQEALSSIPYTAKKKRKERRKDRKEGKEKRRESQKGSWKEGRKERKKEGRREGRKTTVCYYHFYLHCLILFAQIRCHFIEITYDTEQAVNLKHYCLPSLILTYNPKSK
jgi:hypothetical protein